MNAIQIFTNRDFGNLRCGIDPERGPWIVLKDLCDCVDIANYRNVAARLLEHEKDVRLVDTPGGKQEMIVVYEPGIYRTIMRSDKPEAVQFQIWIANDVLPSIRKYGAYITPQAMDKQAIREKAKVDRKGITAAWHDVGGITQSYEYKNLTDTMNKTCLGMNAKQYRKAHGLKPKANTRDHMPKGELLAINAAECMATEFIYKELPFGYYACKEISVRGGNFGRKVLELWNDELKSLPEQEEEACAS